MLVTEASASERLGAVVGPDEAKEKRSKLQVIWVEQGDSGKNFANAVQQVCGEQVRVEVMERTANTFEQLPKRWIVERTFGWLNRFRRLSKDYEVYSEVSKGSMSPLQRVEMLKGIKVRASQSCKTHFENCPLR